MEFKQTQLDNGLTIIAEVNDQAESVAAGFFVRTGSRDETPEVAGVSHFLEHMIFKGTDRRNALEVNLEFDRLGANYNAFTSEENTVYYAAVLPEFQADMLDVLGDILRPSLREEDFDMEKGVICEEIAMYEDRPFFRLYDTMMSRFFDGHPLGKSILGTTESITNLRREDMQAYFDRRYSPTNVTLTAAGKVDFPALVDKASAMCGYWKPFDAPRPTPSCRGDRRTEAIADAKLARQNLGLMSPAPSGQSEEHYAAQLLSTVLGDDTGSRLYYALIEPALADEAHMTYSPMDQAGALLTFISTAPPQAERCLSAAKDVFADFLDTGPSDAEVAAAANKIAASATIKGEQPISRLTAVGFDWVYRRQYVPLDEQIDKLFTVTPDDLQDLARRCDLNNPMILGLGPIETL